jgi:hypothetical protein
MPIARTEVDMVKGGEWNLTSMLPIEAYQKGLRLILRDPRHQPDPVYLLDSDGIIRKQWDYVPTMGEVDDACRQVLAS